MASERSAQATVHMVLAFASCGAFMIACGRAGEDKARTAFDRGTRPDTYPVMLNSDMPFRYPPALYAEKVQGNVTLRLYVDTSGSVVNDSTRVVESSKVATLDSAAVKGSRDLKFVPAKLHGAAMPVSILFPVYFRHPEAPPPPGDSILHRVQLPAPGPDSASAQQAKAARTDSAKAAAQSSNKSPSGSKTSHNKSRHRRSQR